MAASPAYLAALKAGMNPAAPLGQQLADAGISLPTGGAPPPPDATPWSGMQPPPDASIKTDPELDHLAAGFPSARPNAAPMDPGVSLANAGFTDIPKGVAAPLPPKTETKAKAEGVLDPSTLHFSEPKAAAHPEGAGGPIAMPSGGHGGVAQDSGLGKAFDEKKAAIAGVAQAEQRQIEDEGVGHALMGQTITQQAEEARRRAIDVDTAAKMREKEIEDQAKIVGEMKVDPDRRWSNASVGSKIALLIGAAFSGFASGFNHQSGNAALEMASRLQEADIDAQKFNIESAKGKIGEMRGSLADFYKRTGNMDQAVALANAKALDARIEQTNAYAVGSKSASAEARARDIVADMDMQRAQWLAKAQAAAAGSGNGVRKQFETLTQENMKQGDDLRTAQARAAAVLGIQDTGNIGSFAGKGGKGGENTVNLPGGGTGQAITKEGADDFRQRSLGADKFQRAVAEMQKIREGSGGGAFSPSAMARYEGLAAEAKTAYVQMNGFKRTPNETEFHALDKIIPPEISVFGVKNISTDDVLKQASQLADDARKDAAGQYLVQDPNQPAPLSEDEKKKNDNFVPRRK